MQYNLKTLSKEDQFEIRDYFNSHVCPDARLGDFLFEGAREDVSEVLFEACGGDEPDFEFFLLLEDFSMVHEWIPKLIEERIPTERCAVFLTT